MLVLKLKIFQTSYLETDKKNAQSIEHFIQRSELPAAMIIAFQPAPQQLWWGWLHATSGEV